MRILKAPRGCFLKLFEVFFAAPNFERAIAGLLEAIEIPFTGNGSKTLSDCHDKDRARKTMSRAGLSVPPDLCIHLMSEKARLENLNFPFYVKPRCEDSSVGINFDSVVHDGSRLEALLLHRLEEFPDRLIVEEWLPGTEYNAGRMGPAPYEFLVPSSIQYRPERKTSDSLGYDSKWRLESLDYREIGSCIVEDMTLPQYGKLTDMCRRAGEHWAAGDISASIFGKETGICLYSKSTRTRILKQTAGLQGRARQQAIHTAIW